MESSIQEEAAESGRTQFDELPDILRQHHFNSAH